MCGIVGVVARPGRFDCEAVLRAVRALHHRGPDAEDALCVFANEHTEVWLGHARLAILDLSPNGAQPMEVRGPGGAHGWIAFNGEVYDHREHRYELSPRWSFSSTTDTEVLLAGLLEHGPSFLAAINAMLALAAVDLRRGTLILARDRLGKKPLYLHEGDGVLAFASELKAFRALGLPLDEDPEAWAYYRWFGHVPAERSIYRQCRKLPAASYLEVPLAGPALPVPRPELYWDPLAACAEPFEGSYAEAVEALRALLDDAVRLRLHADVPVGVFLSGGIDSSLVAASVARQHDLSTTAFVIKADDPAYDESGTACATARTLGLEPRVEHLRREDYARQVDRVPHAYDEPCSPISQIPTMAIAEAAARSVKVVLTGDGGDEIFLGYPWLAYPERLLGYRRPLERLPGARALAAAVVPTRLGAAGLHLAARTLGLNTENLAHKQRIAAALLRSGEPARLYDYFQLAQPFEDLDARDRALLGDEPLIERARRWYPGYSWDAAAARSLPELLAAMELVTIMRDEILVKVDRATMEYSLEARSPLLDFRIVELGLSLPLEMKIGGGWFKRILRDLCACTIDRGLADRKKSGFGIPPPDGLPVGVSTSVAWGRAVERAWRARWPPTR